MGIEIKASYNVRWKIISRELLSLRYSIDIMTMNQLLPRLQGVTCVLTLPSGAMGLRSVYTLRTEASVVTNTYYPSTNTYTFMVIVLLYIFCLNTNSLYIITFINF